jgi:hypothetical protein
MDAPLAIILEMVRVVLSNTLGTLTSLFQLFVQLSGSLGLIAGLGPAGLALAAIVLGGVLFFLGKFFLKSWKIIVILFIAGMFLIWMLTLGAG